MSSKLERNLSMWLALLAVVALLAGCGGTGQGPALGPGDVQADERPAGGELAEIALGAADNGRQIELAPGQKVAITLESNPTTGYSWQVTEVDEAVLKQVGEVEFSSSAPEGQQLVGAGGTETLRFEAQAAGQGTLTLAYHRSWEEGVEPLETFTVEVIVR
jgi:inhibitor of cysteine peptidase